MNSQRRSGLGEGQFARRWDEQYASGRWEYLKNPREASRYEAIVRLTSPNASVLDLGCGTGVLLRYLSQAGFEGSYTGVDWSSAAIHGAQEVVHPTARFVNDDLDTFCPLSKFDRIVFAEVLYYLPRPLQAIERSRDWLTKCGYIIVTIFRPPRSHDRSDELARLFDAIVESYPICHSSTVLDKKTGTEWGILGIRRSEEAG